MPVPANALLAEDGTPILGEDGQYILIEGSVITSRNVIQEPVNCVLAGGQHVTTKVRKSSLFRINVHKQSIRNG